MATLTEQLRAAFLASEMTLDQLRKRAGLDVSIPSISKKLRGAQVMTTVECERMARALGAQIHWDGRRRPRAA